MAKRDYYEVLGVSKTATQDEIRKANRKLVRQYHPDVNKGSTKTEDKFKEVQEAYDVLSDETKRKNYDEYGHAGPGMGAGGDPYEEFRRQQGGRGQARWQAAPGVTVEDFDAGGNSQFEDMFAQFFGGRAGAGGARGQARSRARAQPPPPQRRHDIEYPVTLTFPQAARRSTLPLQILPARRIT